MTDRKALAEQAMDALRKAVVALIAAEKWLDGWASAEPYITIIREARIEGDAALAAAADTAPVDEREALLDAFDAYARPKVHESCQHRMAPNHWPGHWPWFEAGWQARAALAAPPAATGDEK